MSNNKKPTVILLSAKSGHGKDYISNIMKQQLEEKGNKVLITHYADLLKYILKTFFNWDGQKDEYGRCLLQYVGTDVIRRQKPDYWINFVKDIITMFPNKWDYILIPDARFPNEITEMYCGDFNTVSVRINRINYISKLTKEQQKHESETALDNYTFDYYINNDSTDNVKDEVEEVLNQIIFKLYCKNNKPTAFIDLDCTTYESVKVICNLYDSDFHKNPKYKKVDWTEINSWDFLELSLATKEVIDGYFNQQRFFDKVEMIPYAKEAIDYLSKFYNIVFVSHGEYLNLYLKEKYVNKNFPYAKFIGVELNKHYDKSCVDMSGEGNIFIDDIPKNIIGSNADIKICFGKDYEWNKNFCSDEKDNIYRLHNWIEVLNFIKKKIGVKND